MDYLKTREINVTEHIEKKGQFSYLSWSVMVDELKKLDPMAHWSFSDPLTLPCGSMMVFCELKALGAVTNMQMPVLDFKNNAIKNPTTMHLNTAMQRCLAKAISCHTGIGLHVYKGEDLPPDDVKKADDARIRASNYAHEQEQYLKTLKNEDDFFDWHADNDNKLEALKKYPDLFAPLAELVKKKWAQDI